jgi:hypothetical protein
MESKVRHAAPATFVEKPRLPKAARDDSMSKRKSLPRGRHTWTAKARQNDQLKIMINIKNINYHQ